MEREDNRIICKYGLKCYQKNITHKRKYKHIAEESLINDSEPPSKKGKNRDFVSPETDQNDTDNDDSSSNISELCTEQAKTPNALSQQNMDEVPAPNPIAQLSVEEIIKEKLLVDMPKDFYDLWKHCQNVNPKKPEDAFKCAGLTLCGAFDFISSKIDESAALTTILCHWRYYYDPPEFQTVIAGSQDEYHIGYFRDAPCDLPVFVASMSNSKPGSIVTMGENLFSALTSFLKSCLKGRDIFNRSEIQRLIKLTEKFAEENSYDLELSTAAIKTRNRKVVSKAFHGAGIVVPVCKETDVGYREIPETNATLKKMFKKIKESCDLTKDKNFEALHELMTQVQFANDEGDFGMGLELASDLFTFGGEEFHSTILHLLTVSYQLLKRSDFTKIIKAHLADRRKGSAMSRF